MAHVIFVIGACAAAGLLVWWAWAKFVRRTHRDKGRRY
jgi:DNA-binding transcriptional regulator of glucitol operon